MRILLGMALGIVVGFGIGRLDPATFEKGKEVVVEMVHSVEEAVK